MKIKNDTDILAAIVQASNCYATRPAMVLDDQTYSYQDLFGLAGSICETLSNIKEDIIGITAENRMETYASILAVLLSGKTYVMLHPDYPTERNHQIAKQSGIGLLLYCGENGNIVPADISTRRVSLLSHRPSPYSSIIPYDVDPDVPAYIIFTSGSTGEPKGVPISRKNLNAFYKAYRALEWELDENDRMLQMFELTFDVSVVSFLYPLTLGDTGLISRRYAKALADYSAKRDEVPERTGYHGTTSPYVCGNCTFRTSVITPLFQGNQFPRLALSHSHRRSHGRESA